MPFIKELIIKYIKEDSECFKILWHHSTCVADKALSIAQKHPGLHLDTQFLHEAALLHDIGIFKTYAPGIDCHGELPYICHGYMGRLILEKEGLPKHALVCERHTGTGISKQDILTQDLPIPQRDMLPISLEEQVICYADKFYSKSKLHKTLGVEKIIKKMARFGDDKAQQFTQWHEQFG